MRFLKTIFWVTLGAIAVIFSYYNWSDTEIVLWGNKSWYTKLPVPLIMAFFAGLVPALLLHRTTRWTLNRKIETMERSMADIRAAALAQPRAPATPLAVPAE